MKDVRFLRFAAAVCLLGLVLAGCRPAQPDLPGTSQPAPAVPVTGLTGVPATPTEESELAAEGRSVVLNAMRAQLQTKGVRVHSTITTDGKTIQNLIEFVPPESYHMVLNNSETEIILVDGKTYTRTRGQWSSAPMNLGSITSQLIGEQLIDEVNKTISDVRLISPEVLDGEPVMVYQYKQTIQAGDQTMANSVSKLWLRAANGLPVKLQSEISTGTSRSTLTNLYEYDPTIQITAPKPELRPTLTG